MINTELHGEARFGEYRQKFAKACDKTNKMLKDSDLWDQVQERFDYAFANTEGFNFSYDSQNRKVRLKQIRRFFENTDEYLYLTTYAPKWCFSSALAYTLPNDQDNTIYFNKNKFGHSMMDEKFISMIIIHEAIHIVDFSLVDYEFGHGGNSGQGSAEKKRSAPIWISNAFYELGSRK